MTRREGVRLLGLCAQCEMALVRRDAVAGPLLAQAIRAAGAGLAADALSAAAGLVRGLDLSDRGPGVEATRKVAQALTRIATQEAQAAILRGAAS